MSSDRRLYVDQVSRPIAIDTTRVKLTCAYWQPVVLDCIRLPYAAIPPYPFSTGIVFTTQRPTSLELPLACNVPCRTDDAEAAAGARRSGFRDMQP